MIILSLKILLKHHHYHKNFKKTTTKKHSLFIFSGLRKQGIISYTWCIKKSILSSLVKSQKRMWCDSTFSTSRRICSKHVALHLWRVCLQLVCMFVWASSCIGNVFTVHLRVYTYTVSPCIKSSGRSFSMFPRIHASSCFMSPIRVPQRSKFTGQSSVSQPHGRCDATEPRTQGGGGLTEVYQE